MPRAVARMPRTAASRTRATDRPEVGAGPVGGDDEPGAGEVDGAEPLGVEHVREQVGVVGGLAAERPRGPPLTQHLGDPPEAGSHRAAEGEQGLLAHLAQQLGPGSAQQRQGAVEEGGVVEAEVDEDLGQGPQPRLGGAVVRGRGRHLRVERRRRGQASGALGSCPAWYLRV